MPGNADSSKKTRKAGDKKKSESGKAHIESPVGGVTVNRSDDRIEAVKASEKKPKAVKPVEKKIKGVKKDEKKPSAAKTSEKTAKPVKIDEAKPKPVKADEKKNPVKAVKEKTVAAKSSGETAKPVKKDEKTPKPVKKDEAKPKTVKAADKPGKSAVKPIKAAGKPVGKTVKTPDKPVKLADEASDEIAFTKTVKNVRALVEETVSFIDGMYSANRALSGFGGGRNAVVSDLLGYVCGLITEIGRKNGKSAQAARLCAAAIMKDGRTPGGKKTALPLCVKITVALDIHSGSKSTVRLCGFIGRILSRTAPVTDCTALQAKEPVDGLIAFAVGQGMKI